MRNRHVSIDFETANAKRVSACSIGVAVIEDDYVVETYASLIKPPPEYDSFAPINVKIHGITPDMVAEAPTFDVLYPRLRQIAAGAPILGYSKFDRSVLQQLTDYYHLPVSRTRIDGYVDVCSIAQRSLPQLANHKLVTLARHFNLGSFSHHDASDDAAICALVFLALNGIDVSCQKDCASICRKSLEAMSYDLSSLSDSQSPICDDDESGTFACRVPEMDFLNRPSPSDIAAAFNTFASLILEDNVVDYKEAVELRCFLSAIPPTYGVERLKTVLDAFLEDGVVDSNESSVLVELILNVSAELTSKPIANCSCCGAPVRRERINASLKCPWCGAPFRA